MLHTLPRFVLFCLVCHFLLFLSTYLPRRKLLLSSCRSFVIIHQCLYQCPEPFSALVVVGVAFCAGMLIPLLVRRILWDARVPIFASESFSFFSFLFLLLLLLQNSLGILLLAASTVWSLSLIHAAGLPNNSTFLCVEQFFCFSMFLLFLFIISEQ